MNKQPSPMHTLKRSYSESSILRNSSSVTRPRNDPFSQFSDKVMRTPVLKPTCHKTSVDKPSKQSTSKPPPPGLSASKLFQTTQSTSKILKKTPSLKPAISCGIFSKKPIQAMNPTFSAKNSERPTYGLKPVLRPSKTELGPAKLSIKSGGYSKKMIKRVNNIVFKDKSKRYKSALDFSFANPD